MKYIFTSVLAADDGDSNHEGPKAFFSIKEVSRDIRQAVQEER